MQPPVQPFGRLDFLRLRRLSVEHGGHLCPEVQNFKVFTVPFEYIVSPAARAGFSSLSVPSNVVPSVGSVVDLGTKQNPYKRKTGTTLEDPGNSSTTGCCVAYFFCVGFWAPTILPLSPKSIHSFWDEHLNQASPHFISQGLEPPPFGLQRCVKKDPYGSFERCWTVGPVFYILWGVHVSPTITRPPTDS